MIRSFCFLLCALFLIAPSAPSQKTKSRAGSAIDQDYVLALSAADQFLYAWSTRNEDEGLSALSPKLKNKFPEEYFRSFISGLENPHHVAFEVGRGKRLPSGAFSFPVTLYEHYSGKKESFDHPKTLNIVVTQAGAESWLVDELPGFVGAQPKEQ